MFNHYKAVTAEVLLEVVFRLRTLLRTQHFKDVRLIVIDSVSSIFRDLMSNFKRMLRLQILFMSFLKVLVKRYKILVGFSPKVKHLPIQL